MRIGSQLGRTRTGLGLSIPVLALMLNTTVWGLRDLELRRRRVKPAERETLKKLLGAGPFFDADGRALR